MDQARTELQMDPGALYREELVTDRRVGAIRVLTPVTADGRLDPGRATVYLGEAQVLTPAGALPLVFQLDAPSLADAVQQFGAGARGALERTLAELEQLRQEATSPLVVPTSIPPADLRGGPGGRIRFR